MAKIERAILSCHDKDGIVELAQLLRDYEIEIVSTAGTLDVLRAAGIEAVSISEYTGVPEMMGGRVKTLHPMVHAGLLGVRDSRLHCEQMDALSYEWIDLVVANLHPVEELINTPSITLDEVMEQIDIGGSAMIRSAAKNFRYVTVVVNPERYRTLIHELRAHDGGVSFLMRYKMAQEALACTAHYDAMLADYLKKVEPEEE